MATARISATIGRASLAPTRAAQQTQHMHATTDAVSALRAECARIADRIAHLSAQLEQMSKTIVALSSAPASPVSPAMADIAALGDKVSTEQCNVEDTQGAMQRIAAVQETGAATTVNKVKKPVVDALADDGILRAIAALFNHSKGRMPNVDALSNWGVMSAVARMFAPAKSEKTVVNALDNAKTLRAVAAMFGDGSAKKPPVDALADDNVLEAVAAMFSVAQPKQPTCDSFTQGLLLLTAHIVYGHDYALQAAMEHSTDKRVMQAVADLFQPRIECAACATLASTDSAAPVASEKNNQGFKATTDSCEVTEPAHPNTLGSIGSLETVDLAYSYAELPIASAGASCNDERHPIDHAFGMSAHVQQMYSSASPNMALGAAVCAALHAPLHTPQIETRAPSRYAVTDHLLQRMRGHAPTVMHLTQ